MLFTFIKFLARPVFRVLFSVEHHGVENIPVDGAVIIAGNHPSYLDPLLVGLPIKRTIRFMAWDALFKVPVLGQIIRAIGAFPVDIRKGKGESAFREALRVLNEGDALGIFPEGQRSEQAAMGELRTGVARLAIETGAPIVPVTIGGASRAWPKWRLLPKSAKIVVRYHEPIRLDESERLKYREDREFQQEVMQRVAASINRSLKPAIRGAETIEKWYTQPPPNIRSYEWAPLIAMIVTLIVAYLRGTFAAHALPVILICAGYYLYLMADLMLLKPSRLAKWIRNSMPIWLILIWHYFLVRGVAVPVGDQNLLLVVATIAAFFPFFYEDYFSLQKFVRGAVASYYYSMLLQLWRPHGLGTLVAVLGMIAIFVFWYRVIYRWWIAAAMAAAIVAAVRMSSAPIPPLLVYAALALGVIVYLQTLITIAYDIRRAGNVSLPADGSDDKLER
ncbi:MAG: lysophospholipid acyltransferase family protein [Blastocatellia bacterium]